jgi:Na+/melibiose symporter-like transporter
VTVFGILVRASYTFYNIPHLSLGAEMASGYHQRSTLFGYSAFFAAMSVAVAYGLITGYYFPTTEQFDPGFLDASGYTRMSLTFAAVMVGAILLCVIGTRNQIPYLREDVFTQLLWLSSGFLLAFLTSSLLLIVGFPAISSNNTSMKGSSRAN